MQIEDIVNKVFTRSFMGYDMREVDSFLDDVIDRLERYESERREMLTALEYLLDKLENGGALPEGKRSLPPVGDAPKKRAHGPRMIRSARQSPPEEELRQNAAADLAAEAAVAVELELENSAPTLDELFPELLETLAEMNIPLTDGEDEKHAS